MKIVSIGEYIFYRDSSLNKLKESFEFIHHDIFPSVENLSKLGEDADVLVTWGKLDETVIEKCKNLKLVVVLSTGVDDVINNPKLLAALKNKGITVSYTPGYSTEAVANFTVGAMLALSRKILLASQASKDLNPIGMAQGQGRDLSSMKVGIVGYGAIGSAVAKKLSVFGADIYINTLHPKEKVLGFDGKFVDLEQLCREVDVLSLHTPLTKDTERMIDSKKLVLCKKDVIIVNTARAGLIEYFALYDFLSNNPESCALIDGMDLQEDISQKLLKLKNFYVTPHIAFNTKESLLACTDVAVGNVVSFVNGEPVNIVSY